MKQVYMHEFAWIVSQVTFASKVQFSGDAILFHV